MADTMRYVKQCCYKIHRFTNYENSIMIDSTTRCDATVLLATVSLSYKVTKHTFKATALVCFASILLFSHVLRPSGLSPGFGTGVILRQWLHQAAYTSGAWGAAPGFHGGEAPAPVAPRRWGDTHTRGAGLPLSDHLLSKMKWGHVFCPSSWSKLI